MQFSIIALTAAFASLVSAITVPGGSSPSGNSISQPNSTEIVPVGSPFTITWTPTTAGTISLVLLQGPSTNVLPIAYIAHNISNSGTYQWMVPTSLVPDTTHYGIELIVDDTQAYQYTSQFGISNPSYTSLSSASSASASTLPSTSTSTSTSMSMTTSCSSTTSSPPAILIVTSTTNASTSTSTSSPAAILILTSTMNASASPSSPSNSTTYHAPSSGPASVSSSTTVVSGTKTVVVPITMQTSAAGTATAAAGGLSTTSRPAVAQATGAAVRVVVAAGSALAGMGAVVALLL